MSHEEKQNYVSLISNLAVSVPYLIHVLNKYRTENPTGSEELKYWATAVLLLIPARIAAQIIIFIIFSILEAIVTGKEDADTTSDERDRLIELKGDRFATNTFMFGFMGAMIAIVSGGTIADMFMITLVAACAGEVFGIFAKIYYYRRGF